MNNNTQDQIYIKKYPVCVLDESLVPSYMMPEKIK